MDPIIGLLENVMDIQRTIGADIIMALMNAPIPLRLQICQAIYAYDATLAQKML